MPLPALELLCKSPRLVVVSFFASEANRNQYLSNNFKVNFELELSRSPNQCNLKIKN